MAKYTCCVCGKTLGMFADKFILRDGALCPSCLNKGGYLTLASPGQLASDKIARIIKDRLPMVSNFRPTREAGNILMDFDSETFLINGTFFRFDELASFRLYEFPDISQKSATNKNKGGAAIGGVIGGLSGGLVGGAIGAAVGNKIGSMFTPCCEKLYISLSLTNPLVATIRLDFIMDKVKTSSREYRHAVEMAHQCMDALGLIKDRNDRKLAEKNAAPSEPEERKIYIQEGHLTASQIQEELMIYKTMRYSDLITEEEYQAQRAEIISKL